MRPDIQDDPQTQFPMGHSIAIIQETRGRQGPRNSQELEVEICLAHRRSATISTFGPLRAFMMNGWTVFDQPLKRLAPGGQWNVRSREISDRGWVDTAKIYLSSAAFGRG